jgi:CheY-like chemotaxis protein
LLIGEHERKEKGRVTLEKRILIIDDEQAICLIIAQTLRKKGYPCVIATSWKEALHHFIEANSH